ncbi:hypothetical protein ACM0L0_01900 [Mycoplasma sp. 005V]|uniref:hypothetical protein n=1 Tax=Mycoplasma sp. 005V TaxID=3398776 RepID=UPI003A891736
MILKKLPKTSYDNYISGWEALNLNFNRSSNGADWHSSEFFYDNKISYLKTYEKNPILKNLGISKQTITWDNNKVEIYVANYGRAIYDLIHLQSERLFNIHWINDFCLNQINLNNLKRYLLKCHCDKCNWYLDHFNELQNFKNI